MIERLPISDKNTPSIKSKINGRDNPYFERYFFQSKYFGSGKIDEGVVVGILGQFSPDEEEECYTSIAIPKQDFNKMINDLIGGQNQVEFEHEDDKLELKRGKRNQLLSRINTKRYIMSSFSKLDNFYFNE